MFIGERIRALREEKGLTQLELSKKLNVKRQTVAQWENCERDLKTSYTIALSKFFGVTSDYLLGISDYRSQENEEIGVEIGLSDETLRNLQSFDRVFGHEELYHQMLNDFVMGFLNAYYLKLNVLAMAYACYKKKGKHSF